MDKILELKNLGQKLLGGQHFDCLAAGVLDFTDNSFQSFELCEPNSHFDLASLTKPLTLGLAYSRDKSLFDNNQKLLLEHRAGLPAWGRLSRVGWRDQIQSYSIKESNVLYSDFSALRSMLEWEKKAGVSLYGYCGETWDPDLLSWLDLRNRLVAYSPFTGTRHGEVISGDVHDDNAFVLRERVSHAGLFGTISGVCKSLLSWDKNYNFLEQMRKNISESPEGQRFVCGWDRALDLENTLAGPGCGALTFGHLGFTGTSIWIDPELKRGHVILTNATRDYWYEREGLKKLRHALGTAIWSR